MNMYIYNSKIAEIKYLYLDLLDIENDITLFDQS